MALRKQEDNIDTVAVRESARQSYFANINEPNLLGEPFWKQGILITNFFFLLKIPALRLKLSSALRSVEALRYDFKTKPSEKKQLDMV